MLVAALACAALLRASTAASLGYDAGLRTEGRFRAQLRPGATADDEAAELEVLPRAGLRLLYPAGDLSLTYEPRFTWTDLPGQRSAWYHQGTLAAAWRPEPRWQLTAGAEAARGELGFLEVLARPAPDGGLGVGQPVPAARTVPFERLRLGLGLRVQPEPRLQVRASAEQHWEGGRSDTARLLVPRQLGTRGLVALEWQADRQDFVSGTASALRSDFVDGPDLWAAQAGAAWRRQLSPETSLRLGLGLARSSADRTLLPTAEAALASASGHPGQRLELRLELALAPFVDRLAAAVAERATAALWVSWEVAPTWRVEGAGSTARTLQGASRDSSLWTAELRGSRHFRELLEVGLGLRGLWQREILRVPGAPDASSPLRDRAIFLWVALRDRDWLWH